jgi:hypothetical protein
LGRFWFSNLSRVSYQKQPSKKTFNFQDIKSELKYFQRLKWWRNLMWTFKLKNYFWLKIAYDKTKIENFNKLKCRNKKWKLRWRKLWFIKKSYLIKWWIIIIRWKLKRFWYQYFYKFFRELWWILLKTQFRLKIRNEFLEK